MAKKESDFVCFYSYAVCKGCELVYSCIPSFDSKGFWINAPKNCVECGKKIKYPAEWKKAGVNINNKNYPKIRGQRLLLDCSNPHLTIKDVVYKEDYLEKIWGKKILNKICKK